MDTYTTTEIVTKLIGPVTATGDSSIDEDRLANLRQLLALADDIIEKIRDASFTRDRQEPSMKKIGGEAYVYLLQNHLL